MGCIEVVLIILVGLKVTVILYCIKKYVGKCGNFIAMVGYYRQWYLIIQLYWLYIPVIGCPHAEICREGNARGEGRYGV